MSNAALTAKYRPQTFADVAGQETLKAILSRASLESRVAPAYLFSGTRGVGKTTIARIFAKALNCRNAPTAEPCNQCDLCKAVTLGNAVDVVEIDGASNRGIDDVRRLKEVVGYAPMDGRYKVFIIDEAHMLSREAFNALLKTLEEPPAGVTFIMATTEPHKFPATIISRCQHFVFKRLAEKELIAHLQSVLVREGVEADPAAVSLIARRGAGSVRDSMSLLGQVLALGSGKLTEQDSRSVLGLAGQEAFMQILEACRNNDTLALTGLLRAMLDQGLDMGFFLRELAALWRNLFILKQSGGAGMSVVELPQAEAEKLLTISDSFSLPQIHACWQMTLEGQRRVLTSLEPGLALELLLLNLAMLPQIISLDAISALGRRLPSPTTQGGGAQGAAGAMPQTGGAPSMPNPGGSFSGAAPGSFSPSPKPLKADDAVVSPVSTNRIVEENAGPAVEFKDEKSRPIDVPQEQNLEPEAAAESVPVPEKIVAASDSGRQANDEDFFVPSEQMPDSEVSEITAEEAAYFSSPAPAAKQETGQNAQPSWEEVLAECAVSEAPEWFFHLAKRVSAEWENGVLKLHMADAFIAERMDEQQSKAILESALSKLCGALPTMEAVVPQNQKKNRDALRDEIRSHPAVQTMEQTFGARLLDFGQL